MSVLSSWRRFGDLFLGERGLVEAELAHQRALLGAADLHAQRLGLGGLCRRPRDSPRVPASTSLRSRRCRPRSSSPGLGRLWVGAGLPAFCGILRLAWPAPVCSRPDRLGVRWRCAGVRARGLAAVPPRRGWSPGCLWLAPSSAADLSWQAWRRRRAFGGGGLLGGHGGPSMMVGGETGPQGPDSRRKCGAGPDAAEPGGALGADLFGN